MSIAQGHMSNGHLCHSSHFGLEAVAPTPPGPAWALEPRHPLGLGLVQFPPVIGRRPNHSPANGCFKKH